MNKKQFLGVVGTNGSGKSTFCDYLQTKGFFIVSLSDVIRDYVKTKNLEPNRNTLTEQANILKQQHGLDYCAQKTYKNVIQSDHRSAVFDSIRHPLEIAFLKEKNVTLIGLETSLEQRYERIKLRQHKTDFVSYETFKSQDQKEALGKSFGQSINECLELCEFKLINDSSLEQFYRDIDLVLEKIKVKI